MRLFRQFEVRFQATIFAKNSRRFDIEFYATGAQCILRKLTRFMLTLQAIFSPQSPRNQQKSPAVYKAICNCTVPRNHCLVRFSIKISANSKLTQLQIKPAVELGIRLTCLFMRGGGDA